MDKDSKQQSSSLPKSVVTAFRNVASTDDGQYVVKYLVGVALAPSFTSSDRDMIYREGQRCLARTLLEVFGYTDVDVNTAISALISEDENER